MHQIFVKFLLLYHQRVKQYMTIHHTQNLLNSKVKGYKCIDFISFLVVIIRNKLSFCFWNWCFWNDKVGWRGSKRIKLLFLICRLYISNDAKIVGVNYIYSCLHLNSIAQAEVSSNSVWAIIHLTQTLWVETYYTIIFAYFILNI